MLIIHEQNNPYGRHTKPSNVTLWYLLDRCISVQILADAITAQTAELRAAVDSLKDMTKAFEQIQKDAASRKDTGVSLADLRQELRSFASTTQ